MFPVRSVYKGTGIVHGIKLELRIRTFNEQKKSAPLAWIAIHFRPFHLFFSLVQIGGIGSAGNGDLQSTLFADKTKASDH